MRLVPVLGRSIRVRDEDRRVAGQSGRSRLLEEVAKSFALFGSQPLDELLECLWLGTLFASHALKKLLDRKSPQTLIAYRDLPRLKDLPIL